MGLWRNKLFPYVVCYLSWSWEKWQGLTILPSWFSLAYFELTQLVFYKWKSKSIRGAFHRLCYQMQYNTLALQSGNRERRLLRKWCTKKNCFSYYPCVVLQIGCNVLKKKIRQSVRHEHLRGVFWKMLQFKFYKVEPSYFRNKVWLKSQNSADLH